MKIIFWGTPEYASENLSTIIKSGFEITAVITQPDKRRSRGKKLIHSPVKEIALKNDIPVYTTHSIKKDQITREKIINLDSDIYIVVAFGQILPKEILNRPLYGCWNSHASLLPKWRGAAPIQWSILSGESETGVCIISMEEGLDTGPVINQEKIMINNNDNFDTLSKKLSKISSRLIIKSLKEIEATKELSINQRLNKLNAIEQKNISKDISYARQIEKEDYIINWNRSNKEIKNKIRGLYPNAYTIFKGKRIKILEISIIEKIDNKESITGINLTSLLNETKTFKAGYVLQIIKSEGIYIMTKDTPVLIKSGQLEGKNITDGYTLSLQSKIEINDILG